MQNLDAVKTKWLEAVAAAGSPAALEDVRVKALGKKRRGLGPHEGPGRDCRRTSGARPAPS